MIDFEKFPQPKQESKEKQKELPEWIGEVKMAYHAWKNDFHAMKQELGEREGLIGDIHRRFYWEIATIFYEKIRTIKDLPEYIPLKQESGIGAKADVDVEENQIKFSTQHQLTDKRYYLPRTHELYVEDPFSSVLEEGKATPGNKDFLGFEEMRKEGRNGVSVSFYNLTPPSAEDLEKESRALNHHISRLISRMDYDEALSSQMRRDTYGLTPNQIVEIIHLLKREVKDKADEDVLDQLKNEMEKITDAFPRKYKQAEEKYAERIKRRIMNLTDILIEIEKSKTRLADNIHLHFEYDDRGQKIFECFYLPKVKRLVNVPFKKARWSKNLKPDFSKTEDAPEKEWLNVGILGDIILDDFPQEIERAIKERS